MSSGPADSGQQTGGPRPSGADPVAEAKQAVGLYLTTTLGTLTAVTETLVKTNSKSPLSPLLQDLTRIMVGLLSANVKRVVGAAGPQSGGTGTSQPPSSPSHPPYPGE